MSKPRIGYTTRDGVRNLLQLAIHFSISICGGKAVRLQPKSPKYDESIDGLIIGGGTDLYPALYKGLPKQNYRYDQARDEMEIKWLDQAEEAGLPILGICRGAQLINVRRGGSLHVDVSKAYEDAQYPSHLLAKIFYRKAIDLQPDSLLRRLLGTQQAEVNSMHSQAIDALGEGLKVSAQERNGVVQAVEDPACDFYIGVQFHPEVLIYQERFRAIFKSLILAASRSDHTAAG